MLKEISLPMKNLILKEKVFKYIKPSYEKKLGCLKSTFRFFLLKKEAHANLRNIEKKMVEVISFENFAKLTRTNQLLNFFLLEEYQCEALDLLQAPKDNKYSDFNEYMLKINRDNSIDKKILKLLEEQEIQ
jgi:hypothetical protein